MPKACAAASLISHTLAPAAWLLRPLGPSNGPSVSLQHALMPPPVGGLASEPGQGQCMQAQMRFCQRQKPGSANQGVSGCLCSWGAMPAVSFTVLPLQIGQSPRSPRSRTARLWGRIQVQSGIAASPLRPINSWAVRSSTACRVASAVAPASSSVADGEAMAVYTTSSRPDGLAGTQKKNNRTQLVSLTVEHFALVEHQQIIFSPSE